MFEFIVGQCNVGGHGNSVVRTKKPDAGDYKGVVSMGLTLVVSMLSMSTAGLSGRGVYLSSSFAGRALYDLSSVRLEG